MSSPGKKNGSKEGTPSLPTSPVRESKASGPGATVSSSPEALQPSINVIKTLPTPQEEAQRAREQHEKEFETALGNTAREPPPAPPPVPGKASTQPISDAPTPSSQSSSNLPSSGQTPRAVSHSNNQPNTAQTPRAVSNSNNQPNTAAAPPKTPPKPVQPVQTPPKPPQSNTTTTDKDKLPLNDPKRIPDFPKLPAAPAPRVYGQGYSSAHPIPTVSDYSEIQKKHKQEAEEYARIADARAEAAGHGSDTDSDMDPHSTSDMDRNNTAGEHGKKNAHANEGATEKQRLMDQMNAGNEKPTERYKKSRKGERRVRDPITGNAIIVKDIDKKDFDSTRPRPQGGNVLYYQFPPATTTALQAITGRIRQLQYAIAIGLAVLWFFTAFGNGFSKFVWRSTLAACLGGGLFSLTGLLEKNLEKEVEAVRLDLNRARGEAFSPPYPESTEWLNGLIKLVWGLIDPAFFVPIADMVEDILQQSLPGFVDAVRITDIGQGSNALRFTSIRALPDQPGDEGYPRTDWIDKGENLPMKDTAGKILNEDQAGDYYNFEAAFSYSALPGQKDRAKNIHMLIEFYLGAFDWFHIPVPIWIQVEEIYGIVRLRCQFIPEPPFIRNVTFALCGVPDVEVSAIPMSKHLPNVLDLPFISGFVKQGIAAGTAELSVPKSMTINLKDMLSGATVGDTRAVGIFVITIHYCENLSAQDSNGKSDPYIVLAYAKYGRPLYSTRIIMEDLNPVFEETAVLMLTEDDIKAKEDLAVMLWDSDKHSADDLIGRVQIPVEELMKEPNRTFKRMDKLKGFEDADDMPGTVCWSVGFFTKAPLQKELERPKTAEEEAASPEPPTSPASKEMLPQDAAPNPAHHDTPPPPPDVSRTRPNPDWPSGVLSIVLHQVNNLERQQLEGKGGEDREGEAGQDTDDPSQQTNNLPSGYGEFIVNDNLTYRTRVKQYTNNPYFEAGTEVFIPDYTTTEVRVVIRDSRLRESDPIMGIVTVQLAELFKDCSTVTETYPIQEGQGFGKANISFAFRGMETKLPPNMRGWETGSLVVSNIRLTSTNPKFELKEMDVKINTHEDTATIKRKDATVNGDTVVWADEELVLPVYNRYQSNVVFEFGKSGVGQLIGKGKPEAIAVLWLQDLTDNVEGDVEFPVIVGENYGNLRQNVINDQALKDHKFEIVGTVTARMVFTSGLDLEHDKLRLSQSRRHAYQAYMAVEGDAEVARRQAHFADDGEIDKTEKREMARAHRHALESRGRGMAQLGAYRSVKWMGRGITDRLPGRKKTREPTVQSEA